MQIATLIKKFGCRDVLDLGCAGGFLAEALGNEWKSRLTGIDYDRSWDDAPLLKRYHKIIWADFNKVDIGNLLNGNLFDAIVIADTLEHLNNPNLTIREATKLLKPQGYIISSLPNCNLAPALLIRKLFPNFRMSNGPLDFTHKHFFSIKTAREIFKTDNLAIVETKTTPIPLDKISPIFSANNLLHFFYRAAILLSRLLPNYLSYQFILVYKKIL